MKNIIMIALLLIALACKAQSPIVGLDKGKFETTTGAYFKDLNNELNKFAGTWEFSEGLTSFTITLEKKEQVPDGLYFEDILVGEYKYIENGSQLINTLALLTQNPEDINNRNIGGNYIIPNNLYVACDDCEEGERRIKLYFNDPERPYLSVSIVLRHLQEADEFGQEAQMTATIVSTGGGIKPNEDSPTSPRVPYGEYLMIKQ